MVFWSFGRLVQSSFGFTAESQKMNVFTRSEYQSIPIVKGIVSIIADGGVCARARAGDVS